MELPKRPNRNEFLGKVPFAIITAVALAGFNLSSSAYVGRGGLGPNKEPLSIADPNDGRLVLDKSGVGGLVRHLALIRRIWVNQE